METTVMDSVEKENLKATEGMDQEDKGTEKERGGRDPEARVKAHSESRCCIVGLEQEPCDHQGYPESRIFRRKPVNIFCKNKNQKKGMEKCSNA